MTSKPPSKWLQERQAAAEFYKDAPIPAPNPPIRSFTERQRVEQLLEKAQLSNWETTFCNSVLSWLTKKEGNYLSVKQRNKLEEMEKDFGLDPFDAGDSALPKHVKKPYAKSASREEQRDDQSGPIRNASGFDDMDDDIPF